MARGRQVTIQFIGDARSLVGATNTAGKATSSLGSRFKALGKTAALGAGVATLALGKALWEATEGAIADEKAAKSLALQLKNTTGATDAQVASVEDWITAQGKALGVTDDELRPAFSKLATATGDVTKAQSLLATAMDVSAGTGKSLDSVTSALQKGVNGSVGGLSRLGVKTKDASGETKSFDAILRDLNKNFTGQAAKAADTTAGKYQRLKVNLSELGEEIGYKVLPYATEFGEWLLNKGIPAAEDMAHWVGDELGPVMGDLADAVRDNADELKNFADGAGKRAVDVLETMVDISESAAEFFGKLPGPVKDLGVQAGVAAIVLPRLSAALVTTGTNAATAGIKVKAFTTGLMAAESRGARLGKGLTTLAGVGGMVAISEGATGGSKAVDVLGASLSGAFIGGTIGSVIPGVGTAIGGVAGAAVGAGIGFWKMKKGSDAASDSADQAKPEFDDLKQTLNQVSGAATQYTRQLILQRLEQDGIVASAGQLGIATSDLIKASLGNKNAIERVTTAWQSQSGVVEGIQGIKIQEWVRNMSGSLRAAQGDIKKANAALDGTDRSTRKASAALKQVGKDRPKTNAWLAMFSGDMSRAKTAADTSAATMRKYLKTVGNARTDMTGFDRDLFGQLNQTKTKAGKAGRDIGTSIKSGVSQGLIGVVNNVVSAVQQAMAAGMAAAHSGGKGKGRISATVGGGMSFADFREGMRGFFSSAFSADLTDPETGAGPTIESLLAYQQGELAKAQKLKADIASLVSKGVTKDVLDQIAASGPSGAAQISALAAGSSGQIAQFAALSAQTMSNLSGAGLAGSAGYTVGGSGASNGMNQGLLKKLVEQGERENRVDVKLTGDQIVWSIRKVERKLGVRLLVT